MELATFRELLTVTGQKVLAAAVAWEPTEASFLSHFEKLRKDYPPLLAKAALETAVLRVRAREKFAGADAMYFTREALEQSSREEVAQHRAARFAPYPVMADLGCGIGGDALTLAATGLSVHAIESDPLRAAMAEANAAALGLAGRVRVQQADALVVPLNEVQAAFADPGRRAGVRRYLDPEEGEPPLSAILGRFPTHFPIGVKIAPGVDRDALARLDAEAEFISFQGEMKECLLWFGPLRTTTRRATVLPSGQSLNADEPSPELPLAEVQEYVYDPASAVVRADLAGFLAEQHELLPVDHTVALFTGSQVVESPLLTGYQVHYSDRFHVGRLRDHLRLNGVGRITIVKRGSMIDAEQWLKKLKLEGSEHRFVLLTRVAGEQAMIVGQRL